MTIDEIILSSLMQSITTAFNELTNSNLNSDAFSNIHKKVLDKANFILNRGYKNKDEGLINLSTALLCVCDDLMRAALAYVGFSHTCTQLLKEEANNE